VDQTSPDSGAQLGAQAAEYGQPSMAEMTADLDILQRVLARHGVSQDALARRLNLNPGYLSRVLSGQFPVTFAIFRAVWELTRDPELVALLDSPDHRLLVVDDRIAESLRSLYASAGRVRDYIIGPTNCDGSAPPHLKHGPLPRCSCRLPSPRLDVSA
jgi:hypothetical protein